MINAEILRESQEVICLPWMIFRFATFISGFYEHKGIFSRTLKTWLINQG